ncbi:STM3941 family protein [Polaribacter marinivivus]|uniref:STM3941 family protein n=1 Tax=Polaribacter marinivivus TaxID=1524260 RepID=A0ABV8R7C7_9FLAO
MEDKIEIEISSTKVLLLILGSLLFVILGILMILSPETYINPIFKNENIVRIVGYIGVLFFGLCLFFISKKGFKNNSGLIIDSQGITDNSNLSNIGLIEWNDIVGIETMEIASNKIILIQTEKPEKYIDRAKNRIAKKIMKANFNNYGSPISITSSALKIKFDDLEKVIKKEFDKHKT